MRIHTFENKDSLSPENALKYLKEGNERFISNLKIHRDLLNLVNQYSNGQFPFAAILGCSDSRVPVELVFDQGLGDLFIVRLAGNIASDNAIGSLEFAVKYLGSKVIVVLGHSECGAVKAACDHLQDGNLTTLINHILPALYKENKDAKSHNSKDPVFLQKVIHQNVDHQKEVILQKSKIIREFVDKGEVLIVGAIYNLDNGKVDFHEMA